MINYGNKTVKSAYIGAPVQKMYIGNNVVFSTGDEWDTIFQRENDGTYTSLPIGITLPLNINNTVIDMELIAIDADALTSGGNAKLTWMSKNIFIIKRMNDSTSNGDFWKDSEIRAYLENNILPTIQINVRNQIKNVTKISYRRSSTMEETHDNIFVPSSRELNLGYNTETSGVVYSHFSTAQSRRKQWNGSNHAYFTRSAYISNATSYYIVNENGTGEYRASTSEYGIVIGFCT